MSNENPINPMGTINNCSEITKCAARCESQVLDSTTLNECNNKHYISMGRTGPLIAKIPVVLSDVEVQIDVESEIKLQEAALDIKTIDKHVYLTQCKLIPYTNKLFIAGYIQKNIQFSTIDCSNETSVSGNIQHTTVNIPLKCVTKIKFSQDPIYGKEYKKRVNTLDKDMLGKDQQEDSWIHYSRLYEPIYCELEYAKILETDFLNDSCPIPGTPPREKVIREIVEKMVVFIRLKVLQNQQVYIPEPDGDVVIVEKCVSDLKEDSNDSKGRKYTNIEVGFDPEKGMIGREISTYDLNES
ncbi:hypothetical protein GOM49_07245 [Clostridium bovifaecis]|uniref:DUF7852 domain-containing protein n=1 Tax=Clostridium bovifaecis TaxID=2184719 RepID=A0A6I6EXD9_9CLOT|nr:hypothetical protein GOM49_07245 [Clostridium bovifaecis]